MSCGRLRNFHGEKEIW